MMLEFDFYLTACRAGESQALFDADQCRAAGLDGLALSVELARWLEDPLIANEKLTDVGMRLRLDARGDLLGTVSLRCSGKLGKKQVQALTRELEGQLTDGACEGQQIETRAGLLSLQWLERRGTFDRTSTVRQFDDGVSTASQRPPVSLKHAEKGDAKALRAALDRGCAVNAAGRWDMTALMLASREGHAACVQLLLERGASVNHLSGENGATALTLAAMGGSADVIGLLLMAGADTAIGAKPPLHWAANRDHVVACRKLLEAGANPMALDAAGETALFMTNNPEIIRLLTASGVRPDVRNAKGQTALQGAIEQAEGFERIHPPTSAKWRAAEAALRAHD